MKRIAVLMLVIMMLLAHGTDLALAGTNSSSHKRVALVIGNGKYQYTDFLPKLANPPHDAEDIAAALRRFGFEVVQKNNLNREEMDSAIAEFGRTIGNSEAALFYFAGHGLQVKGQNFIIPVDARIESEAQVSHKGININQLLDEMENSNSRANIVMLDACRNNPISGKFRSGATRGLAAPSSQPKNTIIVYATGPGNVAADGSGRNGLFTAGLLTAFKGSDLSLGGVLTRASEEVERGSKQQQQPFINGPATLQKNFQFGESKTVRVAKVESAAVAAQPEERIKSDAAIEQETWESARDSKNSNAIQEYIKQYPSGRFVGQAKVLIATLTPAEPPSPSITSRIGSLFGSSSKEDEAAKKTEIKKEKKAKKDVQVAEVKREDERQKSKERAVAGAERPTSRYSDERTTKKKSKKASIAGPLAFLDGDWHCYGEANYDAHFTVKGSTLEFKSMQNDGTLLVALYHGKIAGGILETTGRSSTHPEYGLITSKYSVMDDNILHKYWTGYNGESAAKDITCYKKSKVTTIDERAGAPAPEKTTGRSSRSSGYR